jgi:hypothetical protein
MEQAGSHFPPDPVVEAYKKDVDRTLLRENLRKTPDERLRELVRLQAFADELARAGCAARDR